MKTMRLSASEVPTQKRREELLHFMKTENVGKIVIVCRSTGEETVLELEQRDADGRKLLMEG